MNSINVFRSHWQNPHDYARNLKKQSERKILGYFCSYAPEELIHAAGAVPFRLFGTKGDISLADAHLQSYCCSLVRGGLETALNGSLDFLDGAVFPHTCDSIQRLSDIWRLNAGFSMHFDVVLPVKLDTAAARQYMVDVLSAFRNELETTLGIEITNDAIRLAIEDFNRIREKLRKLYEIRSSHPELLEPATVNQILRAAMIMDRKEFLEQIRLYLNALDLSGDAAPSKRRKRIMLSGGICNHPDIYDILAKSGGDVVWDDLCTGARYFEGEIDENSDNPIEAIADRYVSRNVCPAKHMDITARGQHLVKTVSEQQADGVIFLILKFCDPHSFDYPYLKQFLDDAGIPSMLLEIEEQPPPEGQLLTRFETFVEML